MEASTAIARWPDRDSEAIARICRDGAGLVDLWEASPRRIEDNEPHTGELIDALFPGNPLLCCGWSRHRFETRPRCQWHKLEELQLIVPNPMTARTGVTRTGKESAHTLANTGPRRFLVVEQDSGTIDQQAAILTHLATRAPLAMAVHSGGKSLHGWFFCADVPETVIRPFMEYAVTLGADPATWTRSQFVRMPDGQRDRGNCQAVFYFNPQVLR
ncbi:MAG: hypothetical protein SFU53_00455 [Terrimicrobiaceae bacterium]|nr:hypothetical protein [Terrimicrobiaceae bacterium]